MLNSLLSLSQSIIFALCSLAGIGFVIAFHEFGHFICSKMFGIRVQSFSIGFGPKLITKSLGGTEFALSAVPLGGYVDMSNPEGKENDKYSFATRPYYQKLCVMLGGIVFNIIFAYLALSFLFMLGMPQTRLLYPQNATPEIAAIAKDSPAEKAGLKPGDSIEALDGKPFAGHIKEHLQYINANPGKEIKLMVRRTSSHLHAAVGNEIPQSMPEPKLEEVTLTLGSNKCLGNQVGYLGVEFTRMALPAKSFFASIKEGIKTTNSHILDTYYALKYFLTSCDTSNLAGPIMLFAGTMHGAAQGFKIFLLFLAVISINLALLNLIPLPILDGGQILFYSIEALIGRSLPERVREYIFIATWIGFMILTVYMIGQDLMRIAGHYITPILRFFGLSK